MRTRSKSEKQHEDPSRALSDISREAVGRLLNRTKSRKSTGKRKQDSHHCWPECASVPEGLNGQDTKDTNGGPDTAHVAGTISAEEKSEKDSVSCVLPEKKEDLSDSEWEDGFIPIPNSRDHQPSNMVFEFDDSPSSSKRKAVRRVTAEEKELAELVHKVHLLCLVARGRLIDRACNDPLIQGALLSLVPSHLLKISDVPKLSANALAPLVRWFHDNFRVEHSDRPDSSFNSHLAFALENRKGTAEEVAALSVALFRALNLTARFVSILDVASLKPVASGSSGHGMDCMDSTIFDSSTLMVTKRRQVSKSPITLPSQKAVVEDEKSHTKGMNGTVLNGIVSMEQNDSSVTCQTKAEGSKRKGDLEFELELEMAMAATAAGIQNKSKLGSESKDLPSSSSCPSPLKKLKRIDTDEAPVLYEGISTAIGGKKVGAPFYWAEVFCGGEHVMGKWVHVDAVNSLIGREEEVGAATSACKRTLRYAVAFAGNGAKDVTRRYCTKWHTIATKRVNSQWWDAVLAPLKELESRATGGVVPMNVQAESALNEPHKVKTSQTSGSAEAEVKQCGSDVCFQSSAHNVATRSSLEDMELQTRALTEPLPTNQQAYRNHHLYAIERWLNKYEILRPKGPILGYCSGHPVYPRTCVQVLHTRQRWLREGLQIKANENPAKVLKHSPKRSKTQTSESGDCKDDGEGTFALYGKWQTEPLILPHATNGIVPKNERGQVDVWSEKCLPPGTVHLRLPRVFSVAKRLEIDFAPAMVGFDFRNGRSIPVFEGIVVCSEFKDAIVEAYAEEEEKRGAEEKKRRETQALSRWYQLLSGIITRQRLKDAYGDDSTSEMAPHVNQGEPASGVQTSNPGVNISCEDRQGSRSKPEPRYLSEDHVHIFPVEDQIFDEASSVRTKRCPCGFSVQVEEL